MPPVVAFVAVSLPAVATLMPTNYPVFLPTLPYTLRSYAPARVGPA